MKTLSRLLIVGSIFAAGVAAAAVETPGLDYYLPAAAAGYDPAVPAPHEAFGGEYAGWHLHHHELVAYLRQVAERSDRVTLAEYARSHGRRPLLLLTITAPDNHARLETLRAAHLARLEAPAKTSKADGAPLIAWMGYNVHGNEPSASHAAVLIAYHLAATRDRETAELLKQTIVLLDPCINPDGFERFSSWCNSYRGKHPSPHRADREHNEVWPGGRSNYYWFDLNRDWMPAVHPESRGRLREFHRWMPHLVTDYHEMGNRNQTYFFQPGIEKMIHPLIPQRNRELTAALGKEHARALDTVGSLYYAGESFDDFYIGKGSTYPDLLGAVGILFEQAGTRGYHQDTEHGRMTFPFTIRNHVLTSFSTLRGAHREREAFIAYQRDFFRESMEEAAASKVRAHVFSAPGDPARLRAFQDLLSLHRIESYRPAADVRAGERTFAAAEALVVPAKQRNLRLLTAMIERRTEFESAEFYDVSAWHLPSAYGLLSADLDAVPAAASDPAVPARGALTGPDPAYAYVFDWTPRFAPRALFRLTEAKVRCWTATREFVTGGGKARRIWPHGSVVVPVSVQDEISPADLREMMETIAREDALVVCALDTGHHGDMPQLGSPSFLPVANKGVLLVVGTGVGSTTAGAIWHQFDQVWNTPITLADPAQITHAALASISTVILADATYSGLPSSARTALQGWVSRGGCLVAVGSAARSLAGEEWCKIEIASTEGKADVAAKETASAKASSSKTDAKTPAKSEPPAPMQPYAEADERRAEKRLGGIVVRARFDRTHPLAFGLGDRPAVELMHSGTTFFKPSTTAWLNPLLYADEPLVSGYASKANLTQMRRTAPLRVRTVDSGRVIFFLDNPVFRGHWLGSEKLLANAVFFGPMVSTSTGDEEDGD